MGFRDESEAMHAHLRSLEAELEGARERVAELEEHSADRRALADRVRALEAELARHRGAPSPFSGSPASAPVRSPPAKTAGPSKARRAFKELASWLGVFAALFVAVIYSIELDYCGPDLDAEPTGGTLTLAQEPTPIERSVSVSGTAHAEDVFGSARCRGYVPEAPALALAVEEPTELAVGATSATDTVLVLRTADGGLRCDDDSGGGHDPRLVVRVGAGVHRLWLGTFEQGRAAEAELRIEHSR